jgi:hypothetical protein
MTNLLTLLAALDIGPLTAMEGIAIRHCHAGDEALVEFVGHGQFETTNALLTLQHPAMTMLTNGAYVANIRTVCRGATSEVSSVKFVISRPPVAPIVKRGRVATTPPLPPLPPALVMPLPNSTNHASYQAYLRHLQSGKRRSQ